MHSSSQIKPTQTVGDDSALVAKIIESPEQVKQELDLNKKQIKNDLQQIAVREKLLRNHRADSLRSNLTMLFYMGCLVGLLMPNPKVQRVGIIGVFSTLVVNTVAICVLSKREMNLKKKLFTLEEQRRELS